MRGRGILEARIGVRLCEGPCGTQGEERSEVPQKILPAGQGAKTPQGPRDEWGIALVGGGGGWPPPYSELGKALRGASSRSRGGACRNSPKNNALRSCSLRRVYYSLGGGRGGVASTGLRKGQGFSRGLAEYSLTQPLESSTVHSCITSSMLPTEFLINPTKFP